MFPVWLGVWLSYFFGFKWDVLPYYVYCDFFNPPKDSCGGAVDWTKSLVLPWITFSLFFAGVYVRIIRAVVIDARAARARTPDPEERRRLTRRSALSVARLTGRDAGFAIGAAVLVEAIFGIPGIGQSLMVSIGQYDFPVAETTLLYASLLAIAVHFLVDVIVGALDADLRAEWPVARPLGGT